MKKISFLVFLASCVSSLYAQKEKIPPYQKDSTLPIFSMLQTDSTTWFNTEDFPNDKPVVIVYFNPECGHCQLTAHDFMEKKDDFKDVFFVWVTYRATMDEIKQFGDNAKMFDDTNIVLGKEMKYTIVPFFNVQYTPYIAVYNESHKLLQTFDGGVDPATILNLLHQAKN